MHDIFIYARQGISKVFFYVPTWQGKIADQDPQDPEKLNLYMHYKIMDPVDPDPQFYFAIQTYPTRCEIFKLLVFVS